MKGRLWYLVGTMATDQLVMRGAMTSATMELAQSTWNIPNPATEVFLKFYAYYPCVYKCGIHILHSDWCLDLLFAWLQIISIIERHINWLSYINIIIIKSCATFNGICCHQLTHIQVWDLTQLNGKKSKFALFLYGFHDHKLKNS